MKCFWETLQDLQPLMVGLLLCALILLLNTGCATTGSSEASDANTRDFVTAGAAAAAGAYIGSKASDNKASGAAIGAGAGFIVGETVNFLNNKAQREAWLAGYEKGQSNAVKQQYWIAQANQRPATDDGYEEALYQISIPQTDNNGVRREATTRVIRVVTPKETGATQ